MLVLARGQDELLRRMLAPELPCGWVFLGAHIDVRAVRARYARGGDAAQIELVHSGPPERSSRSSAVAPKGSVATRTLRLNLRAPPATRDVVPLFRAVLASVARHEDKLCWAPPRSDAPASFAELAERGRVREALDLADGAGDDPRFALAAARLRASFHDYHAAARNARQALRCESIEDRLAAATVLAKIGHEAEAVAAARAIALEAHDAPSVLELVAEVHRAASDHESAIAFFERSIAAGATPRVHVALGTYAAFRGDAEGARRHARAALQTEPGEASGLLGIADALDGARRDALIHLERAISLRPREPSWSLWRAECLMHLGELEQARGEALRARDLTSDATSHVPALLVRAAVFAELGEREPVDPVLADAMNVLSPGEPSHWSRALRALRGNRTEPTTYVDDEGALRQLAVGRAPRLAAKQALWRFVATADVDEAERDFARVLATYPGVPEPHNYHGELWLYVGDTSRARRCFERALALYERSRWAFIGLAAVELLEGRPDAALATLERGIELAGGPGPTAYVYRGEARRRLGDRAAARADLQHAVELNPSRIGAWINLALLDAEERNDARLSGTMAVLRARAPTLIADAAESLPDEYGDEELLREMLAMLRGNRASTCVTYFTRSGILRTVPPYRDPR